MNNYTVYMHKNKINGKIYIGITGREPTKRWSKGTGYIGNKHFYNAIQKYNWEKGFEHIILYTNLTKEEAEIKEIELIKKYKSNQQKYGYNIENGGHINCVSEETKQKISQSLKGRKFSKETIEKRAKANLGRIVTKETREKLRKANLGKHHSQETKNKISEISKKSWQNDNFREKVMSKIKTGYWKDKHISDEAKQKISLANKGRKRTIEQIERQRQKMTGRKASIETKQKMSEKQKGKNNSFYGKHHTEETRRKLSELRKGKYSDKQKQAKCKKVICIETNTIYESVAEAERKMNLYHISKICKGKIDNVRGYHFKYIN